MPKDSVPQTLARIAALSERPGDPADPGAAAFDPRGDAVKFIEALGPLREEAVIIKGLPNAFAGTGLAERVRATGRTEIVLAGFATHMCVSATARAALGHGFRYRRGQCHQCRGHAGSAGTIRGRRCPRKRFTTAHWRRCPIDFQL